MKVFTTIKSLRKYLDNARLNKKSIGLVPTMGSLHLGHKSLVQKSIKENNLTLCTIFVNPRQFNNSDDFAMYPRSPQEDLKMLKEWNCDVVFAPSEKEIYENNEPGLTLSFGEMETILEGKFRPGHFAGVGLIVAKLFNITKPDKAYFGQKDLQQCLIIKKLVEELSFKVKLRFLNTVREPGGLAISSRNKRLSQKEHESASLLYKSLMQAKKILTQRGSIGKAKAEAIKILKNNKSITAEYFEAVDLEKFTIIKNKKKNSSIAFCVAAKVGDVRLIDNLIIK